MWLSPKKVRESEGVEVMNVFPSEESTKVVTNAAIFIAELAVGNLGFTEIEHYLSLGLKLSVNLFDRKDASEIRERFGQKIQCADCRITPESIFEYVGGQGGFEVLKLRRNVPLTAQQISALSEMRRPLKIIAQSGAGVSHIDLNATHAHKILVTYTPGENAISVAELVTGLIITLARSLHRHHDEVSRGVWSKGFFLGRQVKGMTLGLVGVGKIAEALIPTARGLGMRIIGFGGPRFTAERASRLGIGYRPSLNSLLSDADVVTLHLPLTTETYHLIGEGKLKMMKKGSFLINVARGDIVDEGALAREFRDPARKIEAAALDVHVREGEGFTSPLLGIPEVMLTPHLGGSTDEAHETVMLSLVQHVEFLLKGVTEGVPLARPR